MWPKRNTAFLVIHGAGTHRPYEAVDLFARGFWQSMSSFHPEFRGAWRHELSRRPDRVEHYVSLSPEGRSKVGFFEYYWDCYVDHQVNIREIIDWLEQVSDSARRFYSARPDLALAHQRQGSDLFHDGDFRAGGYLLNFGWIGRTLNLLERVGIARIPVVSAITALVLDRASRWISDMMGDVVIYTTSDVRSHRYAIRQMVLNAAVQELKCLLQRDDFDHIIIVGHSLGSLIAYDAINRIIADLNAGNGVRLEQARKIAGLVTFGSPLDKVAFFFRDQANDDAFLRHQILIHQHGFRRRPFPDERYPVVIGDPSTLRLDWTRWLNFYHLKDPIGGHLDAYQVNENILCDAPVAGAVDAHSSYWFHGPTYTEICRAFFQNPLDAILLSDASCG